MTAKTTNGNRFDRRNKTDGPCTARGRGGKGRALCASRACRFAGLHRRGSALPLSGHLHRDLRLQRDERDGLAQHSGVSNPQDLVALQLPASYPSYLRYRAHNDVFSATLAYVAAVPFGVSLGGRTEQCGYLVTDSYFSTLGVQPVLGRFSREEAARSNHPVVVSYRFWQEQVATSRRLCNRPDDPRQIRSPPQ